MKKATVLLFSLVLGSTWAQTTEVLTSDRPGQTLSANTVGRGVFQIQSGLVYDQLVYENASFFDESNNPNNTELRAWAFYNVTNFRYGLLERFEIGADFISSYADAESEDEFLNQTIEAERNIEALLTLRANLLNTNSFNLAAIASGVLTERVLTVRVGLAGSYNITSNHSLSTNLFYFSGENYNTANVHPIIYTLNYGYSFGKVGLFAEVFGEALFARNTNRDNLWLTYYDVGAWYLFNDNFQLDFSVGTGINNEFMFNNETKSTRLFGEIGITYRIQ